MRARVAAGGACEGADSDDAEIPRSVELSHDGGVYAV
jgi:hypothetical protein